MITDTFKETKNKKFNSFKTKKLTQAEKEKTDSFFTQRISKSLETSYKVLNRIKDLKDLPEKNKQIEILTTKNILSTEIFEVISKSESIKNVIAGFVVIAKPAANIIKNYKVEQIVYRNYYAKFKTKYQKIVDNINSESEKKLFHHLKYFIIYTGNNNYLVTTSANPKISAYTESYTIMNSLEAVNFFNKFWETEKKQEMILPKKNELIENINMHGHPPFSIIEKITEKEIIEKLTLITQVGGKKFFKRLESLLEQKKIKDIEFNFSDFIIKMNTETFNEAVRINNLYTKNKIKFYNNHIKIILAKTKNNFYVINSTSNGLSNSKYEYTKTTNNSKDYKFFINFVDKYFK